MRQFRLVALHRCHANVFWVELDFPEAIVNQLRQKQILHGNWNTVLERVGLLSEEPISPLLWDRPVDGPVNPRYYYYDWYV